MLATSDAGVLGATLTGMVAAGLGPDVPTLAEERVRVASTVEPRSSARARADELHAAYVEGYRALEPLFPRLAQP